MTAIGASLVLCGTLAAGFFASALVSRRAAVRYRLALGAIFLAQVALLTTGDSGPRPLSILTFFSSALAIVAGAQAWRASRAWLERARDPLVLDAPFEGAWRVAAGGSFPGFNHHTIAKDQVFAYDFVRRDGASFGSAILAPIDGVVVAAVDGMDDRSPSRSADDPSVRGRELGNHVAIQNARGCVFLCHLQKESVRVGVGTNVNAGDPIGLCGNSGRTYGPHLHIHAQDEPAYAFDRANGIPIAFRKAGRAKLLRRASVLVGR